jgi:glutaconate CoA-transferase subunit A
MSRSKLVNLAEMAALIEDGDSLALGGSFLHRGPFALVRELIRQGRRDLEIIKQSPGYDIDILCRAGAVSRARCGIVAMEGNFGMAPYYRRAIESGAVTLEEHACATLTAGMRAAAFGIPFQPVGGVHGSDLAALNGWVKILDPYGSGQETWVIPRIQPDFAVIHVAEATAAGDARLYGTPNWDHIMTRSAAKILILAEKLVDEDEFAARPELTLVPHFMTAAVALAPQGAWPGSCWPYYGVDYAEIEAYMAEDDGDFLARHLAQAPELSYG